MTTDTIETRKSTNRRRANASETPRPTISFRVRADIYERLKLSAQDRAFALTEEIEHRIIKSFELEEQVAHHLRIEDLIVKRDTSMWPTEADRILGAALSSTVAAAQQRFGQSWRESGSVAAVVVAVMRDVMTKLGRPGAEFDTLLNRARIDEATSNIAKSIVEMFKDTMPPLPKVERPREQSPVTSRARNVTVFKDKATGTVLDTFTSREFDITDPNDRPKPSPEYLAALDKYRPKRDSIDVEESRVYVLEDGGSIWDTLLEAETTPPEAEPAVRFASPKEVVKAVPAENRDPTLFQQADFDEARGPDRGGNDTKPEPDAPAAPAPAKRRRKLRPDHVRLS